MNGFEWVGFFISIVSVFFLVGKAVYDTVMGMQDPGKQKAQQEEAERRFKKFLRGEEVPRVMGRVLHEVMDEDEAEEVIKARKAALKKTAPPATYKPLPQPAAVELTKSWNPTISDNKEANSRAKWALLHDGSNKNMVILYEILGPPKGLR